MGLLGVPLEEGDLVAGEALADPEPFDGDRALDGEGWDIESAQRLLEAGAVGDVVQQLGDRHEAHALDLVDDEGVEVVAALFAVRDDVDPGVLLVAERLQDGLIGHGGEVGFGDLAGLAPPEGADQVRGASPAPNGRHRKQHGPPPSTPNQHQRRAGRRSA